MKIVTFDFFSNSLTKYGPHLAIFNVIQIKILRTSVGRRGFRRRFSLRFIAVLFSLLPSLAIQNAYAFQTTCSVFNDQLSFKEIKLEVIGQKEVHVSFYMHDKNHGTPTQVCQIISESQTAMRLSCLAPHGSIELQVFPPQGKVTLSAEGRSGQKFSASSDMKCTL